MFKAKRLTAPLALIAGSIVMALALQIRPPAFLAKADLAVYDAWLSLRPPSQVSSLAALIYIDEASLAEFGPWPWPRFLLAELAQRLVDLGAAAVALDLDLSEPDAASPGRLAEELKKRRDLDLSLAGLPEELRDYDSFLARTLGHLPAVLGAREAPSGSPASGPAPPSASVSFIPAAGSRPVSRPPLRTESVWPLAALTAAAPAGLADFEPDEDGAARRARLARLDGGELRLGLSLRTLLRALNRDQVVLRTGPDGLEAVQAGAREAPLNRDGSFNLSFKNAAASWPRLSAGDILAGRADSGPLKGRLAFVGLASETLAGPRLHAYTRAELHAAVIDDIAAGLFIDRPGETPAAQFLLIVGAGLFGGLFFAFARPGRALAAGLAIPAAAVYGSLHLFQTRGLFLSPLYVGLAAALAAAALAGYRLSLTRRKNNRLRLALAGRLTPAGLTERDLWAGEERDLTVLSGDWRGLDSALGLAPPRPAAELFNGFIAPLADLTRNSQGFLDSFGPEGFTAFWNAPLDIAGHPERALAAALALKKIMAAGRSLTDRSLTDRPLADRPAEPAFKIGFGLSAGPALVGVAGLHGFESYRLFPGEQAGLARRLAELARLYDVDIIASEALRRRGGEAFAFQLLDRLAFETACKPMAGQPMAGQPMAGQPTAGQPTAVFAVLAAEEGRSRAGELERHQEALESYLNGDFPKALRLMGALAAGRPEVRLYEIFKKRCEFLVAAPPADWNGVWRSNPAG